MTADSPSAPAAPLPASPPPPPRACTAKVSARLWFDPRVRFCWLIAAVLAVVAIYFLVARIHDWKLDSDLVRYGVSVVATVGVEGVPRAGYVPPAGTPLILTFPLNGQELQVTGTLEGQSSPVATAQKIAIRVDPNDLSRWTDLTEPRPVFGYLIVPILIVPVALAVFAAAWWFRRRLMVVWKQGTAAAAVVVDRHHSALAPTSQAVRCTLADRADKRVMVAYLPARSPRLQRGQRFWLICGPRPGSPFIAADWLQ